MLRKHPIPTALYALASRTANSVLLESARSGTAKPATSHYFSDPVLVLRAERLSEIPALFAGVDAALARGLYIAGFLSYECGYHFEPTAAAERGPLPAWKEPDAEERNLPLAWFGVFREPLRFDHETGCFSGPLPPGLNLSENELPGKAAAPAEMRPGETAEAYVAKAEQVRRLIELGDTYQANLTMPMRGIWPGDPAEYFAGMMRAQPVEFGAFLHLEEQSARQHPELPRTDEPSHKPRVDDRVHASYLLSASPELFFRILPDDDGNRTVHARPMKGTTARGRDLSEDAANALWLSQDEKNRSENLMIVDLMRSDLGRICTPGSVRVDALFEVERYSTVLQMTSSISGTLRPDLHTYEIFRSLFPCGSIVGAPKVRTMQIIRELEQRDRGAYTGSIGYFAPDGSACFSVAIRTVTLDGEQAEMGVGAGITYDSDPSDEYRECLLKARFLEELSASSQGERGQDFQLIESLLWRNGYPHLARHLARLSASAAYFDFVCDSKAVSTALEQLATTLEPGHSYKVRLLLTRHGAAQLSAERIAEAEGTKDAGVTVSLAKKRTDSHDPFLRHKTTRRALYNSAFAESRQRGHADALFLNEKDELTEGAIHNIFLLRNGEWLTPPLDAGVLPGIFRESLLDRRPGEHQNPLATLREARLTLDDLCAADAVYLTNAVRGLRRVRALELPGETQREASASPRVIHFKG